MVKEIKKTESNACPKCGFEGNESFPKGFASENYPKLTIIKKNGQEFQEVVRDSNRNPVLIQIKRCPKCGYKEEA